MSNAVLPAARSCAVVGKLVHDPAVDVLDRKQFVRGRLDGHEDEGGEGVGRLGVHVDLRVVGHRWDDGESSRRAVALAATRSVRRRDVVAARGDEVAQQVALLQPVEVGEVVVEALAGSVTRRRGGQRHLQDHGQ